MTTLSQTEKGSLDRRLLDAMEPDTWYTADRLAGLMGRSRKVDGYVVGARLRSLRHFGKVESRPAIEDRAFCEWAKAGSSQ